MRFKNKNKTYLRGHPHITSYSWRFYVFCESLFFSWSELNIKNSTKQQQSCRLVEFLVFNSAFGRQRHWLIPMESPSFIIIVMSSIIHHGLIFRGDPPNIKPWWMIDDITMMMNEGDVISINQYLCAEGRVEHQILSERQHFCFFEFLVFNSIP